MKEADWKKLYHIAQKQALLGELYGRRYMEYIINKMNVIKTDIEGVLIIEPRLFRDARGYFFESFSEREFKEKA